MGSVDTFLRKRTEGTERSDKAAPNKGVEKFWGEMPTWGIYEGQPDIDLVIVPAIDGNFDPASQRSSSPSSASSSSCTRCRTTS